MVQKEKKGGEKKKKERKKKKKKKKKNKKEEEEQNKKENKPTPRDFFYLPTPYLFFPHFFTHKNTYFPYNFVFYYHPKNKLAKILEVLPRHLFFSSFFSMKDSLWLNLSHFLEQENTKKKEKQKR